MAMRDVRGCQPARVRSGERVIIRDRVCWPSTCGAVQDGRSLEDKILHYNPMREDASDEEQGRSDGEDSDVRCGVAHL